MISNSGTGPVKNGLNSFVEIWQSRKDLALDDWIVQVSESYFSHGLGLESSASIAGCQPAELQAAILIATLEEDVLKTIAQYDPPITTWFFLVECPTEHIETVLKAIADEGSELPTAEVANRKIRELLGPDSLEAISALDSRVFAHLHEKAMQYDVLSEKSRRALKNFGARVKSGRTLTIAQMAYAKDLLTQLADLGLVRRNSPDDDEEIMVAVLKSLGRV